MTTIKERIAGAGIQARMGVILIVIATMILTGSGAVNYFKLKATLTGNLNATAEITANRLAGSLELPLWNDNIEILNKFIASDMEERQVYAILVYEAGGKTLYAGKTRDSQWKVVDTKETVSGRFISRTREIKKDDEKLGVIEVYFTTKMLEKELNESLFKVAVEVLLLDLALLAAVFVIMRRIVIGPILAISLGLKDIAQGDGDLTMRLAITRQDEIGELAGWFNTFMEKLHTIISRIDAGSETLNTTSQDLLGLAGLMSEGAGGISEKAEDVTGTVTRMNGDMSHVADAMARVSENIERAAFATEEMNATVGEIAKETEEARIITHKAVTRTESTSRQIEELGHAAREIETVTETITEISEQTNLLALNATIEASRAGSAGMGFAVVANEIKTLATQTAQATDQIRERIALNQEATLKTVAEIEGISRIISDVNTIVSNIAAAVEEQSTSTTEIAGNVSRVSRGIQKANGSIAQSAGITDEVSNRITEVSSAAATMSERSSSVNTRANDMLGLAAQLREMVGTFKV